MNPCGYDVVNAISLARNGFSAGIGAHVDQREHCANVFDAVITDGHIRHCAYRTAVLLIFWAEENGVAILAEASPGILKNVAFEQHALSILQLKQVLDDEGPARR